METMKAIAKRKSTRSFQQVQVPEDILTGILEAGCAAPVGMGRYDSLHITVIQDKEKLTRLSNKATQMFAADTEMLYGTPTLVLVSSKEAAAPGIDSANVGFVLGNMALAAADKNVDSCVIWSAPAAINTDAGLREALAIPDGFRPVGSIALGYATVPDAAEKEMAVTISVNRV